MDRIYIAHLDQLVRCRAAEEKAPRDVSMRAADGYAAIALAAARLKARGAAKDGAGRR